MPAGGIPPALGTINYEAQHGQIKRQSEHLCLVAIDTLDPYVRRGQEGHGVGDVVKAPRGEHLPQVLLLGVHLTVDIQAFELVTQYPRHEPLLPHEQVPERHDCCQFRRR
jgi:hypothetical protein